MNETSNVMFPFLVPANGSVGNLNFKGPSKKLFRIKYVFILYTSFIIKFSILHFVCKKVLRGFFNRGGDIFFLLQIILQKNINFVYN